MKRILTLILVIALALTALVGCDTVNKIIGKKTEDNHVDETPNETPDETPDDNQPGGEQPDDNQPSGELGVDAAIKYVHLLYKDLKKETKRDFDLVGKVPVDGVDYFVIWTSNNDKVAIKESSKAGMWTVDIPDSNEAEFTYTLTATITDADGNVREKSYDFVVPVIVVFTK